MNFEQILAQKIAEREAQDNSRKEANLGSKLNLIGLEPDLPPNVIRFTRPNIPYENRVKKPPKSAPTKASPTPPPEHNISVEKLDSAQQISLQIFMKLGGIELQKESFSPSELKKCYRKLAKKYHPDLSDQGNTEHFQQLKLAYDCLKTAA